MASVEHLSKILTEKDLLGKLNGFLPTIIHRVVESILLSTDDYHQRGSPSLTSVADRIQRMIHYTSTDGKRFRAVMFLKAYYILVDDLKTIRVVSTSSEHSQTDSISVKSESIICAIPEDGADDPEKNELQVNGGIRLHSDDHVLMTVAWCIELLQSAFLVADDLMDQSLIRRGKPCWYLVLAQQNGGGIQEPMKGISVVNDIFLLCAAVWGLIDMSFGESADHKPLILLFHDVFLRTIVGQQMDMDTSLAEFQSSAILESVYTCVQASKGSVNDQSKANKTIAKARRRYETIIAHKTTYYTLRLPLLSAVLLASARTTKTTTTMAESGTGGDGVEACLDALKGSLDHICSLLGQMFQIRDDMLDWDEESSAGSGKTMYTDIAEGKLTWPLLSAMGMLLSCDDVDNMRILMDCYGKEQYCSIIAELYSDLGVKEKYMELMESLKMDVMDACSQVNLPRFSELIVETADMFCH